ncbi:MAG: AI-2E family transporter [Sphingomonadaceae bacterium]
MRDTESDIAAPGTWCDTDGTAMLPTQLRASLVAVALLVLAALVTLKDFLPALGWAAIFAIALTPLYDRLVHRWPAQSQTGVPALIVIGVLLAFVIPMFAIAVPLLAEARFAAHWIHQAATAGLPAPAFLAQLPFGPDLVAGWQEQLGHPGGVQALAQHAMHSGNRSLGARIAGDIVHRLVLVAALLLALYFLLREFAAVKAGLRIAGRRAFGASGERVGQQMIMAIRGTVNGLVFVSLGQGLVMGVVYAATGVLHPVLFALMTALLAIIPFGIILAIGAASLILLAGTQITAAVLVIVIGLVVTFIADHFVRPVLIGDATRLPFVWVLFGILGGIEAWGLIGVVMGPAIMAALMMLWREWVGSIRGPLNPPADV